MKPPRTINKQEYSLPNELEYLAKTIPSSDGKTIRGVDVLTHCKIVGLVARELIRRQPDWLRNALFPSGSEFVSAVHDIGKISPGFQEKIYRAIGAPLNIVSPELDKNIGGHAAVSQAALDDIGGYMPEIVGRHHGWSSLKTGLPNDDNYGGKYCQDVRLAHISRLKEIFQSDWPEVFSDIHADVLTGLTTVADWIGSRQEFSTADNRDCDDTSLYKRISKALDSAGFIRPRLRKGLMFEEVFPPYSPYPVQKMVIEEVKGPGVYVLEAPMGLGKTEAALYAAYQVMEMNRATGIYFALPTQLTSDRMIVRMEEFLSKILEDGSLQNKARLLHGAAWLKGTFMGKEGEPGRSWFDSKKRGLLAPFAVGTIDQALMAVMNVRHGFVRTFGLAGKVVILDEVHSYDSYTGTILDYLVKALNEIHCTVIILSATLAIDRRSSFFPEHKGDPHLYQTAYPLLSASPRDDGLCFYAASGIEEPEIDILISSDDDPAIDEAILRAERGEQVLWLENTVSDAQGHFQRIGARAAGLGIECGLLHSRFLKKDRETNEERWVDIFGKQGRKQRGLKGRILVGTQVLEQSLDIDGDFLVTRACPTDMLLQRLGRLWRHRDTDPYRPASAMREAWILAPSLDAAKKDEGAFGKTAWVYAPYVLCRSLEIWRDEGRIKLTGEKIRALIEATYKDRSEEDRMALYKNKLEKTKDKLSSFARIGISRGGVTLPESKATTRYSEAEDVEVLLFRSKYNKNDGILLMFLDDSTLFLPKDVRFRNSRQWREIAAELQRNTVMVPERLAPRFVRSELGFLGDFIYLGNEFENPFRAALVRDSGEIVGIGQQDASDSHLLRYDRTLGYLAIKANK